jgi:hypothetical protein
VLYLIELLLGINAADALLFNGLLKDHAVVYSGVLGGRSGVNVLFFLGFVALIQGGKLRVFFDSWRGQFALVLREELK